MQRFVGAAIEQFELLFEEGAKANIAEASYPPCCWAEGGPLRFRRSARNALSIDVRRCALRDGAHFRLDLLFTRGTCTFGSPADLARFWNEVVADAFGLPRGPVPPIEQGPEDASDTRRSPVASERREQQHNDASNAAADELASRLHRVAPDNYLPSDRSAREQLTEVGWPPELISRIDTIGIFRPLPAARTACVARAGIRELATEYDLAINHVPRLVTESVLDSLTSLDGSARSIYYAARRLLAPAFVGAVDRGLRGSVRLEVGPPPSIVARRA